MATPPSRDRSTADTGRRLLHGAGGTGGLHLFSTAIKFLTTLFLAQWLGASEFGAYMYAMSWSLILILAAHLGSARLVVREVASLFDAGRFTYLRRLLRGVLGLVLGASVALVALAAVVFLALSPFTERPATVAAFVILPLVPIIAIIVVLRATLEGTHHVVRAQLPEQAAQPIVLAALLTVAYLAGTASTGAVAGGITVCSYLVGLVLAAMLVRAVLRPAPRGEDDEEFDRWAWLRKAAPLMLLSVTAAINMRTDVVMLGILSTAQDAGVYGLVTVAAGLLLLLSRSLNTALGPHVVRLQESGEREELQRLLTRSIRVLVLISLGAGAFLVIAGRWALGLLGPAYPEGWVPLIILVAGQIVNVGTGSAGLVLVMSHHEKDAVMGYLVVVAANIALNAMLIPAYGPLGAAVATVTSTTLGAGILVFLVRSRLGMDTTLVGVPRRDVAG